MTEWVGYFERLGEYLWTFSWEIAVLILLVAGIERLMRRRSSAFRYLLWMVVLVRLAVPVTVTLPVPRPAWFEREQEPVSAPVTPVIDQTPVHYEQFEYIEYGEYVEEPQFVSPSDVEFSPPESMLPPLSVAQYAGMIWGVCTGVILCVIIIRWLFIKYALRNTIPLRNNTIHRMLEKLHELIGLRRRVPLHAWKTKAAGTVALAGVVRPRILIPRVMADTWPTDDLSPILLHELAHVKRADLAVNWLQIILQALFFFHPLVWFANRRIRRLREEACDDIAVAALNGSRKRYVESMLRIMEEATRTPKFGFAAMGFAERSSNIGERIRRIMDTKTRFSSRLTLKSVVALAVIALTVTVLSCGVTSVWRGDDTEPVHAEFTEEMIIRHDLTQNQMDVIKKAVASDDLDLHITVAAISASDDTQNKELLGAVNNVVKAVNRYTGITATMKEVSLGDPALLSCQMAFMLEAPREGDVSPEEQANFESYFEHGGTLFIEWSNSEETSNAEKRRLNQFVADALGVDYPLFFLTRENILNHSFFDFDNGPPRGAIEGTGSVMEAVLQRRDQSIIVSNIGYMQSWNEGVNEQQLQFGVNLVVFSALRENGMLETEATASEYKPIPIFYTFSRPYIVFRNLNNRSRYVTEAFEVEVLDDDIYRIGDEWIDKDNIGKYLTKLRDFFETQSVSGDGPYELPSLLFKRDNELVSMDTILNTMNIARDLGFKKLTMTLDIQAPKNIVYVDIMDDTTYYFDEFGPVSQADLRDVIYSRALMDGPLFVVSSTSPASGYSEALPFLEHTFRNVGALYTIKDTDEHIGGSQQLNNSGTALSEGGMLVREAQITEKESFTVVQPPSREVLAPRDTNRSVSNLKPELYKIEVIDDDTYLINGDTISKEDLEDVLQGFDLNDKDGVFTLKYDELNESAYEYFMDTIRRLAESQRSGKIEIEILDDATYRIAGERISRDSLKDVFQQRNELADVSALETVIRYYPSADIKAADYAVEVAESFGVTNIQMSVEMDPTTDVLIKPYNESYFNISWWQEKSELIPYIFRGLEEAGKKVYVVYETNKFVPPYDKSLEVSYKKSLQNIVSQLEEIGVDYHVVEMKYWSDSAQNSGAGITSAEVSKIISDAQDARFHYDWGQDRQLEQLKIEILDGTTFRVFGETVAKDDLAHTLQTNLDPDVSYIVLLSTRNGVLSDANKALYNDILNVLIPFGIVDVDFVEADEEVGVNEYTPGSAIDIRPEMTLAQNTVGTVSESWSFSTDEPLDQSFHYITVKIISYTNYQVNDEVVTKDGLEQAIRENMNPDTENAVIVQGPEDLLPPQLSIQYHRIVTTASEIGMSVRLIERIDKELAKTPSNWPIASKLNPIYIELRDNGFYRINGKTILRDDILTALNKNSTIIGPLYPVHFQGASGNVVFNSEFLRGMGEHPGVTNGRINQELDAARIAGVTSVSVVRDDTRAVSILTEQTVEDETVEDEIVTQKVISPIYSDERLDPSVNGVTVERFFIDGIGFADMVTREEFDITVMNKSIYLVDGEEVHRDDLEQALREKVDRLAVVQWNDDDVFDSYAFINNTFRAINHVPQEGIPHLRAPVKFEIFTVDIIDGNTILFDGREMTPQALVQLLNTNKDPYYNNRLIIRAGADLPVKVIYDFDDIVFAMDKVYEVQ